MNLYPFNHEETMALSALARERIQRDREPLLAQVVEVIVLLAMLTAFAFSIVTTIVVWSHMEVFGVNITG